MKPIYWAVKSREGSAYVIEFWTKADKSNALTFKSVTMDPEKISNKITALTGNTRFELHFIKGEPWRSKR